MGGQGQVCKHAGDAEGAESSERERARLQDATDPIQHLREGRRAARASWSCRHGVYRHDRPQDGPLRSRAAQDRKGCAEQAGLDERSRREVAGMTRVGTSRTYVRGWARSYPRLARSNQGSRLRRFRTYHGRPLEVLPNRTMLLLLCDKMAALHSSTSYYLRTVLSSNCFEGAAAQCCGELKEQKHACRSRYRCQRQKANCGLESTTGTHNVH